MGAKLEKGRNLLAETPKYEKGRNVWQPFGSVFKASLLVCIVYIQNMLHLAKSSGFKQLGTIETMMCQHGQVSNPKTSLHGQQIPSLCGQFPETTGHRVRGTS